MTMKTYLALALLINVLAGNAYGDDEIYYCAETDSNGFEPNENLKKYSRRAFRTNKFKIKFDRTAKTVEIKGHRVSPINKTYPCTAPYARIGHPELLSCTKSLNHFNFNTNNGLFVFAMLFGYVSGDGDGYVQANDDSISVSYGKCDKF
jgi:hypothetical protein